MSDLVHHGNLVIAVLLAVLGGLVSFASPCTLPLVPGFLGYMTGLVPDSGGKTRADRARLVLGALLFSVGFTAVFLSVSVLFTSVGAQLAGNRQLLLQVGGAFVLLMGIVFLGVGGDREWRVRWRPAAGLAGAPLLGAAFGLGMSACSGPVLGGILALSTSLSGDPAEWRRGVGLALAYSAGMALPFLAIAAGWSRMTRASRWLRDHHRGIQLLGGGLLVCLGALMLSGAWESVVTGIQSRFAGWESPL